jgi:hypothetical protein
VARIRSLKIGFFENEELARQPYEARLLFGGLWLLADREGRLEDRPLRVKARLFPYDALDAEGLLSRLHDAGFILRYVADGAAYIQIVNFLKHQRPKSDETASVIPLPPTCLEIPRGKESPPHGSELGKDRGELTEDRGQREPDGADAALEPDRLVGLWNSFTTAPIPRCKEVSDKRRKHMKARLTERPLADWQAVIERIERSTFCRGFNERGWIASFDWLIGSPEVAIKVLEGKYDDRRKMPRAEQRLGYQPTPNPYAGWEDECRALHDSACGHYRTHELKMQLAEKAS